MVSLTDLVDIRAKHLWVWRCMRKGKPALRKQTVYNVSDGQYVLRCGKKLYVSGMKKDLKKTHLWGFSKKDTEERMEKHKRKR